MRFRLLSEKTLSSSSTDSHSEKFVFSFTLAELALDTD
ncbi:hypothetical protein HSB1_40010 [Halogranum salarium B-1]|uniref:Uncharacterized protein n=1 Tax=Halogranum salarium B-1 TaxID=1210908 RepID=J2ZAE6_9EURY|nr:hypothetical protein HSB1_40010 [Halogranum salarium B-1]